MNGIPQNDEHGVYYFCSLCLDTFDDITAANRCCSHKVAGAEPEAERLPEKEPYAGTKRPFKESMVPRRSETY